MSDAEAADGAPGVQAPENPDQNHSKSMAIAPTTGFGFGNNDG